MRLFVVQLLSQLPPIGGGFIKIAGRVPGMVLDVIFIERARFFVLQLVEPPKPLGERIPRRRAWIHARFCRRRRRNIDAVPRNDRGQKKAAEQKRAFHGLSLPKTLKLPQPLPALFFMGPFVKRIMPSSSFEVFRKGLRIKDL